MSNLLDVINAKLDGISSFKLVNDTRIFCNRKKEFQRQSAVTSIKSTRLGILLIKKMILFFNQKKIMWMSGAEYLDMTVQIMENQP